MRLEVFSPPYLFKGPRPVIAGAPDSCRYGDTIRIDTPDAASVRWAGLVSCGVTTHSFDSGQRLVDLEVVSRDASGLSAEVTGNPDVAPPGWYMLFLTDQSGVSSIAHWINLHP